MNRRILFFGGSVLAVVALPFVAFADDAGALLRSRITNAAFAQWLDVNAVSMTRPKADFFKKSPECEGMSFGMSPPVSAVGPRFEVFAKYPDGRVARAPSPISSGDRVLFSNDVGFRMEKNDILPNGRKTLEVLEFRLHHFFGGSDLGGFRHRLVANPGSPNEEVRFDLQCGPDAIDSSDLQKMKGLELGMELVISASETPPRKPLTEKDAACSDLDVVLLQKIQGQPQGIGELKLAGKTIPLWDDNEDLEAAADQVTFERKDAVEVNGTNQMEKTRVTLTRALDGKIARLEYVRSVSKSLGLFYKKVETLTCIGEN